MVTVVLAGLVAGGRGYAVPGHWAPAVLAWAFFCAASNVLPVPAVRNVYLSMSSPVNIAIAVLFPPGTAALLVAFASVSEWEIRRQTTLLHAFYNRAQLGLSAAAAAAAFGNTWTPSITPGRAVLAVVAYQLTNWGLVAAAETTCRGLPLRRVVRGLLPRQPVAAVSYFVLGLMGVALAVTYQRVGAWAVALLMLPLLGARHAVAAFDDLERAQRAQRALANRLIDERERERTRIASDIHDVVLQELAGLQLVANNVRSALAADQPQMAEHLAVLLEESACRAIAMLRGSIVRLHRAPLAEAGLDLSLARYVRAFTAQSGIEVTLETDDVADLPLPAALLLYECCLEALTNVARHAYADHGHVALRRINGAVELTVSDDGIGVADREPESAAGLRAGLRLLQEKVELAGGRLAIAPRPGGGTAIEVSVPVGTFA